MCITEFSIISSFGVQALDTYRFNVRDYLSECLELFDNSSFFSNALYLIEHSMLDVRCSMFIAFGPEFKFQTSLASLLWGRILGIIGLTA